MKLITDSRENETENIHAQQERPNNNCAEDFSSDWEQGLIVDASNIIRE